MPPLVLFGHIADHSQVLNEFSFDDYNGSDDEEFGGDDDGVDDLSYGEGDV